MINFFMNINRGFIQSSGILCLLVENSFKRFGVFEVAYGVIAEEIKGLVMTFRCGSVWGSRTGKLEE